MKIATLSFAWAQESPLVSGYGNDFVSTAEWQQNRERKIYQFETRNEDQRLTKAVTATSIKGVVRSAAAWYVEREGHIQQRQVNRPQYITREYADARPAQESWRATKQAIEREERLDPVARVFGGSGGDDVSGSNAVRRTSLVRFTFANDGRGGNDALYGEVRNAGRQVFAWEEAEKRTNPLETEQFVANEGGLLGMRVQSNQMPGSEADFALALALIGVSVDLINSGFFRFGRLTSRGYGWLKLMDGQGTVQSLGDLVDGKAGTMQAASSGTELARLLGGEDPTALIRRWVREWIDEAAE